MTGVPPDEPVREPDVSLDLQVERLNEMLRAAGSASSEQAFGLGCGLGFLPLLVVVVSLLVFRVINIILAFILLVMSLLAVVGVGMLLASYARANAMRRVYRDAVEPEIRKALAEERFTLQEFDVAARLRLPEAAPLLQFLDVPSNPTNTSSGGMPGHEET